MIAATAAAAGSVARSGRRVWIGLLLAVVGIGLVFWEPGFTLLVVAIALGSLWELGKLAESKGVAIEFTVAALAVLAYIALTYFRLIGRFEGDLLSLTIVSAMATATFLSRGHQLMRSAFTLLGVLYIGKLLSYFVAIRALPGFGIAATIYVIVVIALTDIAAMLVGVTCGRTPLTPLSPRKTVEGAVGGFVVAVAAAIGIALYLHWHWWDGAIVGACTSIAAQAGDVVESALKRDAAVKDAGSAIAGHGGVLDRFDSYLFGGITFYFALMLIGKVPLG
ncbi:MAG: phosphatidate cytidylyltransferase [Candidatus Velthaea sp.]